MSALLWNKTQQLRILHHQFKFVQQKSLHLNELQLMLRCSIAKFITGFVDILSNDEHNFSAPETTMWGNATYRFENKRLSICTAAGTSNSIASFSNSCHWRNNMLSFQIRNPHKSVSLLKPVLCYAAKLSLYILYIGRRWKNTMATVMQKLTATASAIPIRSYGTHTNCRKIPATYPKRRRHLRNYWIIQNQQFWPCLPADFFILAFCSCFLCLWSCNTQSFSNAMR